jgi:hypothetical protein
MNHLNDPNLRYGNVEEMGQYDKRVQWAAVAVLLLLCGGIFVAAMYSDGSDTQTAMKVPSAQTTGQATPAPGPAPSPTPQPLR